MYNCNYCIIVNSTANDYITITGHQLCMIFIQPKSKTKPLSAIYHRTKHDVHIKLIRLGSEIIYQEVSQLATNTPKTLFKEK